MGNSINYSTSNTHSSTSHGRNQLPPLPPPLNLQHLSKIETILTTVAIAGAGPIHFLWKQLGQSPIHRLNSQREWHVCPLALESSIASHLNDSIPFEPEPQLFLRQLTWAFPHLRNVASAHRTWRNATAATATRAGNASDVAVGAHASRRRGHARSAPVDQLTPLRLDNVAADLAIIAQMRTFHARG